MLDPLDVALHATYPVVAAPRFGPLEPMTKPGQRMIVAANGIFLQVNRPWIDCIQRVGATDPNLPLVYGDIEERLVFAFGTLPQVLFDQFVEAARAALPDEVAAAVIWSGHDASLRLDICDKISASHQHVTFAPLRLARGEVLVCDLHSHGADDAFFSPQDDEDDVELKLTGVFGRVNTARPCAAFRLCINGWRRALPPPWLWGRAY